MTMNYHITFSSELSAESIERGPTATLGTVVKAFACVNWRPVEGQTAAPAFNADFVPTRPSEGGPGIAVSDGRLLVDVECDNVRRPVEDRGPTKIEALLAFLSTTTSGPAGEVVGGFADGYGVDRYGEVGLPLVRCADGMVRVAYPSEVRDEPTRGVEPTPMPAVVPVGLVTVTGRGTATMDVAALRRSLAST